MRLLRVLDLAVVLPRLRRHRIGAVQLARLVAGRGERRLGQRRRVGAHVGDVAVLVETLGDAHRLLRREPELAARLLLQRRGHERRRGAPGVGLLLDRRDGERRPVETVCEATGLGLGQLHRVGGAQLPVLGEVAALGNAAALDRGETRGEAAGLVRRDDVPVLRRDEPHPLALALDDEPRRDRLHATRRQALHDLPPEHRRDLVAVQPVEDAPRLLSVDEPAVDVARLAERPLDRGPGDLVEDHAPHRHLRVEHLAQMPGDRLALAVFVRREQELVGVLELRLEVGDDLLLARVDDVQRLEVLVDVDAEAGPGLALQLGRDLRGVVRKVADVADRRFDHIVRAQIAGDRLRLGGRLHDHELLAVCSSHLARHHSAVGQISDTRRR